jgi:hypothetical protein
MTRGRVCPLQLLLAFASAVILGTESRRTHNHILLSQIRDPSNLEGQVSPRGSVSQLYPRSLGSLHIVFYDSQGYGGGIPTHLHVG